MSVEFLEVDNIASGATVDIFVDALTGESQSRFIDRASQVTIAIEADAVGIELTLTSGKRTIVPRSTLDAGGTVGVFPNINEKAFSFFAAAGEILRGFLRETAAVATTDVMATVSVDPIGQ